MTYQIGDLAGPALAMAIPVLASLVLWASVLLRGDAYRKRYHGRRLWWERWGSTALITLVLFGVFYWYLFWRPFYRVTAPPGEELTLGYVLPDRAVRLGAEQIASISIENERLPVIRRRIRQYLQVRLADGRTFASAPMMPDEARLLLVQLHGRIP